MSSFTEDLEYEFSGSYWGGNPQYVITKEFSYKFGDLENPLHVFKIPVGYETDLASIPWPLNLLFRPNGPWAKAAVLHDFIYTDYPEISKVVADAVFLEAMIISGVNRVLAHIFFLFVRLNQFIFNKS